MSNSFDYRQAGNDTSMPVSQAPKHVPFFGPGIARDKRRGFTSRLLSGSRRIERLVRSVSILIGTMTSTTVSKQVFLRSSLAAKMEVASKKGRNPNRISDVLEIKG